ncbi:hypothetical protein F8M41_025306 [Gigaspora margarita]|uniref:Uncharacterized protein n=1 Tax=Gigaspora margarita TaxID=4874 RepID=A0A8H4ABN3_GIGMA|nr:hypothetical protein F8M41_025306 [Gigaspora margarita]
MNSPQDNVALNEALITVHNGLQEITRNLQLVCSSLREICINNIASIREFIDFRHKILKYILVYYKEIFPLIKEMTLEIQNFMENYTSPFEEFQTEINFIIEDFRRKKKIFITTLAFHVFIQEDFKREKSDAAIHFKKLESDTQPFKDLIESVKSLVILIQTYIDSLSSIAKSFITLEEESKKMVSDCAKIKDYYTRCRDRAQLIIDNCMVCTYEFDSCKTDLSIEADNNYVRSWLNEKESRIGNRNNWLNNFLNSEKEI